ncbi:alpha,alpha-trehalase [Granulicella rosea]|uniref:Alpha,alpha-trehalase n=1 Tax=Granulicella rosea TaxID=474952 RepID=A0A239HMZ8_9BACT|nr:trehalase family glycosidase [Granulicella rosea]SNS82458.1 alpha,alpha-trehalase [Granulicella rosea]
MRLLCGLLLALATSLPAQQPEIRQYIAQSWDVLARSMSDCKSVVDQKVRTTPILYLPAGMKTPGAVAKMQAECHVDVRSLPRPIHRLGDVRPSEIPAEGLLYLPNPYVVPGGRFNEMYGWDSYFILLGLVRDGHADLARGMVENFFFEIENYGAILNANRTYFFTRSQPPFLSSMIREVYEHPASGQQPDAAWLARAYSYAERDYALWISPTHRVGATGLARYRDLGEGPVPEMADDSTYYPDVIRWLLAHPGVHPEYLVTDTSASCDATASKVCAQAVVDGHRLSQDFYRGDRAMRESGFDTTFRFGAFSGSTQDYAPVCLNSLLYKYERDMEHIAMLLHRPNDANLWSKRARARRAAIDRYLWDAKAGLYFDYDYVTQRRSGYKYITAFYPLWAGAAGPEQAAAVRAHLKDFEQPGGLATSATVSGVQWDAPFGWAPVTWLAVSGLDRAGFHADAARIATKFSATVLAGYRADGTIREKYNVVSGSADVQVETGYKSNVVGFGWTNGVYLEMQDLLHQ